MADSGHANFSSNAFLFPRFLNFAKMIGSVGNVELVVKNWLDIFFLFLDEYVFIEKPLSYSEME
jgi:hypothetical protein